MKALKISLILGLLIATGAYFNDGIAQTFGGTQAEKQISPRLNLIRTLLLKEITDNKAFSQDAEAMRATLRDASEDDSIGGNCYKYIPLLVEAVNSNALLSTYYNVQGNFGYSFVIVENNKPKIIKFNFYEVRDDAGNISGISPSVNVRQYNSVQEVSGLQAQTYINNNYCKPLNQILDQNSNLQISQLLGILKQRFSK